jgi:hypothetical protein
MSRHFLPVSTRSVPQGIHFALLLLLLFVLLLWRPLVKPGTISADSWSNMIRHDQTWSETWLDMIRNFIRHDQTWSDMIILEISVKFFLWTAITNFDRTCPADLPGRLARQTCPADLLWQGSAVLLWQGSPAMTRQTWRPWLWQYSVIMNKCSLVAWKSDI